MIAHLLSSLINTALSCDPETAQKLQRYHAKKIKVHFTPIKLSVILEIKDNTIAVYTLLNAQQLSHDIDAEIVGTPFDVLSLLLNKNSKMEQLKTMSITGDILLVQELEKIFSSFEIDFEEKLSHLVGDSTAYTLHQGASFLKQFFVSRAARFSHDLKEYLEDEKRFIVSRNETRDFCHDIDELRHQVDRLEAKIQLLTEQHKT